VDRSYFGQYEDEYITQELLSYDNPFGCQLWLFLLAVYIRSYYIAGISVICFQTRMDHLIFDWTLLNLFHYAMNKARVTSVELFCAVLLSSIKWKPL
jgi:hypothetical protein